MNIYEIDAAIEELIANSTDPETGELVLDEQQLDELQMERSAKVENIALYIKNAAALADDIKAEEKALAERRKAVENKIDRLKSYLDYALGGEKFQTARVACSYRRSESVELSDEFIPWASIARPGLVKMKVEEVPDKAKIKELLKSGETVPFAQIVEKRNIQIK